ncbi:hypothetical protein Q0590_26455 [Rhodocytophaga aerolata]|uniref:Uncharacterized protein n=1 Tax=Rhodocytophaga aerolata TaxID=455078 RepID=A0ABT8RCM3_9BACT|nr:hypothetical protein [Rhodocytophaga aerolata]MDO1449849.1 hypothetical protein [Rhodocytophaga aerolata]
MKAILVGGYSRIAAEVPKYLSQPISRKFSEVFDHLSKKGAIKLIYARGYCVRERVIDLYVAATT